MKDLLSTNGLTKKFGRYKVVNAVNIHIRQGDIYGLIGRNGAGKTTILKMISGLVAPTEGDFSLFEKSGKAAYQYMSRIGTLIEAPGIYPNMSAYENMKLKCIAMGVRKQGVIEELLNTVGLGTVGKKKVKNFSLGMKQRLGIALALVGDPDLVILDEPINGLDPIGIAEMRNFIKELSVERGKTILISSHILSEIALLADDIGIIDHGLLLEENSMKELKKKNRKYILLQVSDVSKAALILEHQFHLVDYSVHDDQTLRIYDTCLDMAEINKALIVQDIAVISSQVCNDTLEDYFKKITGGEGIA